MLVALVPEMDSRAGRVMPPLPADVDAEEGRMVVVQIVQVFQCQVWSSVAVVRMEWYPFHRQ